ncbi:MAG: hypothetical protein AAF331_00715 [Pseudomonadota bacterium]
MRAYLSVISIWALQACGTASVPASDYPTLTGEPPLIIAHRGASGELPEHTIEAYSRARLSRAPILSSLTWSCRAMVS